MSLTVLIPIKNESQIIDQTITELENSWIKEIDHEIIFLDDFSSDNTVQKIKDLDKKKLNISIIKNTKPGLGSAIYLGVTNSKKDYFTIFMADLSDSIEDMQMYYNTIKNKNLDSVFGSRFIKGGKTVDYPVVKLILNRLGNLLAKFLMWSDLNDFTNGFKIYKKNTLIGLYPLISESFNIFFELPLKTISRGYKYKIIPISYYNRTVGEAKFKIDELGSKYLFTLLYCFLEKSLLRKDIKKNK